MLLRTVVPILVSLDHEPNLSLQGFFLLSLTSLMTQVSNDGRVYAECLKWSDEDSEERVFQS